MDSSLPDVTVLDALDEPALIAGGGRILAANAPARGLLGKAIAGARLEDVIVHPAALEAIERPGQDVGEAVELTGLGKSRRHWLMRLAPLAGGSTLVRFVDSSEARAAEQMRVDFVANASHELRTPLATLIGYAETLREQAEDIDPATRERFLAVVHDEARRMQRVVEDLISLSRIEAEKFIAPTDAVAIEPLIAADIEMDVEAHRVRRSGKTIQIGPTEYRLLRHLMESPGRAFSRERLLDAVWSHDPDIDVRTVDVHVRRLRKALNEGGRSDVIRTVRSAGYALDADG